jgi:hypothetical protein
VVEAVPLQVTAPPPAVEAVPLQFTKPVVEAPAGPRVELGFRDGSTTSLAPESAQARALTDIASLLTRRD